MVMTDTHRAFEAGVLSKVEGGGGDEKTKKKARDRLAQLHRRQASVPLAEGCKVGGWMMRKKTVNRLMDGWMDNVGVCASTIYTYTQTIQAEWEAFLESQPEAVREGYKGLSLTIEIFLEDAKAMVRKKQLQRALGDIIND